MMAGLFLLYVFVMLLLWFGQRKAAMILGIINLILILAMFWYHVTDVVNISL
jgi:Family of unknown function (DUF5993)